MPYSSDYKTIRDRLIRNAESFLGQSGLNEARIDFTSDINSNRRSSCLRNFSELISLLEKRGHVGEHSIEPMRKIAEKFHDPYLQGLMDDYEAYLQNHRRTFFNVYGCQSAIPSAPNAPFQHRESSSENSSLSYQTSLFSPRRGNEEPDLPENVILLICTEIGRQWMELARSLKIREGEIDGINDKCQSNLKAKAREVLKLFVMKTDPEKWQVKLLNGLVQARRKDLKESVEELLIRRVP